MKYFKIKYADGRIEIKSAENALALIRRDDLASRAHVGTRIFQLSGEQEAIARSNEADAS